MTAGHTLRKSSDPCAQRNPYSPQLTLQSTGVLMSGGEMAKATIGGLEERVPLNREWLLRAAIAVADAAGVRALTIRSPRRRTRCHADVGLLLRRQLDRDPRRHRRCRLQ